MFTFIVNIFLNFFLHMSKNCSTFALDLKMILSATFAVKPKLL